VAQYEPTAGMAGTPLPPHKSAGLASDDRQVVPAHNANLKTRREPRALSIFFPCSDRELFYYFATISMHKEAGICVKLIAPNFKVPDALKRRQAESRQCLGPNLSALLPSILNRVIKGLL
jgi:hypothetical protein